MTDGVNDGVNDRGRRLEHQKRAYDLQIRGGLEGALKYTVLGTIAVCAAHYTWPLFRRQTLGLKAFLVSSATMSGLVIGADHYLLKYESHQRDAENQIRRDARNALARQGIIATETEIRRWRAKMEAERVEIAAAKARDEAKMDEARAAAFAAVEAVDAAEIAESVEASTVARLVEARQASGQAGHVEGASPQG